MQVNRRYFDEYRLNLLSLLAFETRSLLGRLLFNSSPTVKNNSTDRLLNLGCGSTILKNWTNADFYNFKLLIFNRIQKSDAQPDWFLDLRYPLNCNDNFWDGIFTEHTLEHLYPKQAIKLIEELHRVLKSGCWLRITVPDLEKYVNYYNEVETNDEFSKRWDNGCEALRSMTQDYFHHSVWDADLLCTTLENCGFKCINVVSYKKGSDERLLMDREERKWETLYVEAQK